MSLTLNCQKASVYKSEVQQLGRNLEPYDVITLTGVVRKITGSTAKIRIFAAVVNSEKFSGSTLQVGSEIYGELEIQMEQQS